MKSDVNCRRMLEAEKLANGMSVNDLKDVKVEGEVEVVMPRSGKES